MGIALSQLSHVNAVDVNDILIRETRGDSGTSLDDIRIEQAGMMETIRCEINMLEISMIKELESVTKENTSQIESVITDRLEAVVTNKIDTAIRENNTSLLESIKDLITKK